MKKTTLIILLILLIGSNTIVIVSAGEEIVSTVLNIDLDKKGALISPLLYGAFLEDINHTADGGLYAEMVRNRSFEFLRRYTGWQRVYDRNTAKIEVEDKLSLNENNTHYIKLSIDDEAGELELRNYGYGGMVIEKDKGYRFSVYARCEDSFDGFLRVILENEEGKRCGEAKIEGLTAEWQQYSTIIKAGETSTEARLVVMVAGTGSVCLDMISLFPIDTWKGRENGLRKDLVEVLAEMKPAFIRFPGGCIVEGNSLVNAYRWKDTIGDPAVRKGNPNLWGYYQSYGLGFYDYFLLCGDLGAEPVPIVNAGISCQVRGPQFVPLDELDEWVQDALDLIEYANGPADSFWGAKRAASGHPEPFNLKYLGIGNENWGREYYARFEVFQQEIRKKYPEIKLIIGAGVAYEGPDHRAAWNQAESIGADIFDEHMYCPPQWFYDNVERYDSYDRGKMDIFVGEYAAHGEGNSNNLEAALAEAAFMTGLERNSDLVTMSAYAPLYNKVGSSQWTPDLIWFNNTDVYGTPGYYVQQIFSQNQGDIVIPSELLINSDNQEGNRALYCVTGYDYQSGDIIIKMVNKSGEEQPVKIDIRGGAGISGRGRAIILSSDNLRDENSFAHPRKVAPVIEELSGLVLPFNYVFKGYSVTILRLNR